MFRRLTLTTTVIAATAIAVGCGGKKSGGGSGEPAEETDPSISNEGVVQPDSTDGGSGITPIGPVIPPMEPVPPPAPAPSPGPPVDSGDDGGGDENPPPAPPQTVRIHRVSGFVGLSFADSVSEVDGFRGWSIGVAPSRVTASGQTISAQISHVLVTRE